MQNDCRVSQEELERGGGADNKHRFPIEII